MGISKKKLRKQTKITDEEINQNLEDIENKKQKDDKNKKAKDLVSQKIKNDDLFKQNLGTLSSLELKIKREKLRDDRFKQIKNATTSKTDEFLIKRFQSKIENKSKSVSDKKEEEKNKYFGSKKKINEDEEFGGELQDIWATQKEIKSKKFDQFKEGFAKKDLVSVKAVIVPKTGISYNPSLKSHQQLLKSVAEKEQEIIDQSLQKLKKIRPLLFEENDGNSSFEADSEEKDQSEEVNDDGSDLSEQKDQNIVLKKPINREDIKTKAQRNKDMIVKLKLQRMKEERQRLQKLKQVEKLDKIIKTTENETKMLKKRIEKRQKQKEEEIRNQELIGIVNKPKIVGRFRYNQRKEDFQLEEDLSGNLRQIKPLGNDQLLNDRFDSIFRRNLVEPDAPTQNEKKRQRKQKFKYLGKIGEKAMELNIENQKLKQKNDQMQKGMKNLVRSDVIMI